MQQFVHILAQRLFALLGNADLSKILGCLFEIVVDFLLAELADTYLVVQTGDSSHLDFAIESFSSYPTIEFGTLFVVSTVISIDSI